MLKNVKTVTRIKKFVSRLPKDNPPMILATDTPMTLGNCSKYGPMHTYSEILMVIKKSSDLKWLTGCRLYLPDSATKINITTVQTPKMLVPFSCI